MSEIYNFYFGWIFYNIIILILSLLALSKLPMTQKKEKICVISSAFLFFILAIFGNRITPDYPSYKEIVMIMSIATIPYGHIEDFYKIWIPLLDNNYFLYVFLMNFVSLFVLCVILLKMNLRNVILFLCVFSILLLYEWINGRQYLFMSVYFLGVVLFSYKRYFLAILLLFSSLFLHKISYLAIFIFLLSLFQLRQKRIECILFLFLIVVALGNIYISDNLEQILVALEDSSVSGRYYLALEEGRHDSGSLWWHVIRIYQITVKFILAFFVLYHLRKIQLSHSIFRMMYSLLFWSVLVSLFFYSLNLPDDTLGRRTFSIGLLTMCYLYSKFSDYFQIKTIYKACFIVMLFFYLLFNNAYIVGVSHTLI